MTSWMTDWAEKGGSLLNSLDSRVASLLKNDVNEEEENPQNDTSQWEAPEKITEPQKPTVIYAPVQEVVHSKPTPSTPSKAVPSTETSDTQLFEFLNSPAPMEQAIIALKSNPSPPAVVQRNSHQSQPVQSSKLVEVSKPTTATVAAKNASDVEMENRLLHQEVASLNQEIAELIKRNKRSENDAQQRLKEIDGLRDQVQSLKVRLEESKRIAPRRSDSTSSNGGTDNKNVRDLELQIEKLTKSLTSTRQALTESESKANEALKLADLSSSRVKQLQQEVSRLTHSLASYKEKAGAILSDKEKVISELRDQLNSGSGSIEDSNLRREYEQLQEETIILRQEVDQRLLAASEMEERVFEEHASFRRTISLLEQQLQREKQLVSDSDAEIIDLQRRLNVAEEASKRDLASLNGQLRSAEAEIARLRRCLAETPTQSPNSPSLHAGSASPSTSSRNFDAEAKIFELEAKARQLNDSLLTKQDALEATLAQNHALKIRLDRLEAESDAHLLDSERSKAASFASGYPQLPQSSPSRSPHGFVRLYLIDTSLPNWLHSLVSGIDDWMIRFVAMLRRRPMIRLLLVLYLGVFPLWLLCSVLLFTPPVPSPHPP